MNPIEIQDISKTFVSDFSRKRKKAVRSVSLTVEEGESFGIIGVNGAGKSTTIKMIMGFVRPDSGSIFVSGRPPRDPASRIRVGYLPENPYFYDNLTAKELLTFSARGSGLDRKTAAANMDRLLEIVGLSQVKNQKVRTFSKGMTQRCGICFALVHDPDIIIFDEPMSGLDPYGRRMVIDLIQDLKDRGKTILFCSHILTDVERICDRVGIMDAGEMKKITTKAQILESADQVRVVTDALPPALETFLTTANAFFRVERTGHVVIKCAKDLADELILVCKKENADITAIDYAVNNMEEIFLKTIHRQAS